MIILGIESTCDETSVGIVEDGVKVLSNVVASSASMHQKYGGVVPEIAARQQVKVIKSVLEESLSKFAIDSVDAFAIAYGPGLIGSLLVGVETAKTLSIVFNKPLIKVNHLVGHFYATLLLKNSGQILFPAIALVASGGHTDLLLINAHGDFRWIGGTLDDAAGESFDKVARIIGLKYPGGPEIEKLAGKFNGTKSDLKFPSSLMQKENFNFSFSGIKTSVLNYTLKNKGYDKTEVAFSFEESVVNVLVRKTIFAAKKFAVKSVLVGGGVSANHKFRSLILGESKKNNIHCFLPEKNLSGDNGAMIAAAAYFNKDFVDPLKLQSNPSLYF